LAKAAAHAMLVLHLAAREAKSNSIALFVFVVVVVSFPPPGVSFAAPGVSFAAPGVFFAGPEVLAGKLLAQKVFVASDHRAMFPFPLATAPQILARSHSALLVRGVVDLESDGVAGVLAAEAPSLLPGTGVAALSPQCKATTARTQAEDEEKCMMTSFESDYVRYKKVSV